MPTAGMGRFRDLLLTPQVGKSFFPVRSRFLSGKGALHSDLRPSTGFSTPCEDTAPVVFIVFKRVHSLFRYPDAATGNLSRPIPSRMARNNSRGTATSAIWKIICREWRTTFAPILVSFSRNVVNVQ